MRRLRRPGHRRDAATGDAAKRPNTVAKGTRQRNAQTPAAIATLKRGNTNIGEEVGRVKQRALVLGMKLYSRPGFLDETVRKRPRGRIAKRPGAKKKGGARHS